MRQTPSAFFLRNLVINPIIDTIRFMLITLICMAVFYYGQKIHLAAFICIVVVVVTAIVYLDIAASSGLLSLTRGKLTPLEEADPELLKMVNEEWKKLCGKKEDLNCYVMKGESGHSNAFVSKGKLVIYDSMFEHIRERHHMMAIIRHEMGHAIFNHITKITLLRIVYYDLFFIGTAFLVYYKKYWLPMFGINYNSVFLALFCVMQFLHFRIFYYCYNIAEHAV